MVQSTDLLDIADQWQFSMLKNRHTFLCHGRMQGELCSTQASVAVSLFQTKYLQLHVVPGIAASSQACLSYRSKWPLLHCNQSAYMNTNPRAC